MIVESLDNNWQWENAPHKKQPSNETLLWNPQTMFDAKNPLRV